YAKIPSNSSFLPHFLGNLANYHLFHFRPQNTRNSSWLLWPALLAFARCRLGCGTCAGIWPDAVRRWLGGKFRRQPAQFLHTRLSQRHYILHAWFGRRRSSYQPCACARRLLSWIPLRLPRP